MARLGKLIWIAISIFFGLLVLAGILYAYGTAVIVSIKFAKIDLSLPSSLGEVFSGLLLALFISLAAGLIVTVVLALATSPRVRNLSGFSFLLAATILFISNGGLLIFIVPTWIAVVATVLAVGIPAYVVWQERNSSA